MVSEGRYDCVPCAVPRWWFKDWLFSIWVTVFGHTLGARQPFRWILFRELTERDRINLRDKMEAQGKLSNE